ncbi:MAG: serine hydrolase domain-containing protein [Bergeyella sp.]
MKKLISFFLIFGAFFTSFSQAVNTSKLDEYFNVLEENKKVMGSFAIAKNDKIIYTKTIGLADSEPEKKADNNTLYRIGSISKTFTAVLTMKAVEEKKLKLDTQLNAFFPQIKNAEKISIDQLLSHRSGIHNFTDDIDFFGYYDSPVSQETLLSNIQQGGNDFEPGEKYSYSNSNYVVLALILEKIYKKNYASLVEEKIIKPLKLKNTRVMEKIDSEKGMAHSFTYSRNKIIKSKETHPNVTVGAGNMMSTPSDLLTFIMALENGKLVRKESLKKMQDYKDDYGYGLFPVPFHGKTGYGHNGRIDDFQSVLYYFPDGKISFAMVTNQSNFDNNSISIAALSAAYGMGFKIPSFKIIQLKEEELQPFAGTYSHPEFPLKINIFIKDGKLLGQATGQGAFPLDAVSQNEFTFEQAGITMKFNAEKGEMFYTQMGQALTFTKEK